MYKDPTEFRKRFAAWKDGKKPYQNGKIVENNYTNASFNPDGTFTDDTTRVFDDLVITPKGVTTKYGSYTDKNWNRYKLQEKYFKYHDQLTGKVKAEPGLKLPEIDPFLIGATGGKLSGDLIGDVVGDLSNLAIRNVGKALVKPYAARVLGTSKMKHLSPTEKIELIAKEGDLLNPDVPNSKFKKTLLKDPVIKNLLNQGVDIDNIGFVGLNRVKNAIENSIATDSHLAGRRAAISESGKTTNLYDGAIDAEGNPFKIGTLRLDGRAIDSQNVFADTFFDYGMQRIPYSTYLDRYVRGVHMINNFSDALDTRRSHVGLDLYNAALDAYKKQGGFGIMSGKELLSPRATYKTINPLNFQMIRVPNAGLHYIEPNNGIIGDVNIITKSNTGSIPYKEDYLFDVNLIDDFGNIHLNW